MKIIINGANLRGFGSRKVGQGVLRAWARQDFDDQLTAWLPDSWQWSEEELGREHRIRRVTAGMPAKFVADNFSIRRDLKDLDADALFSLGDTSLVASQAPHLLLVQQAYLAYSPEAWGYVPSPRFRAKMSLMAAYFRAGCASVTRFTVQSHAMKSRLCARWNLASDKVFVVPSAIDIEASTGWGRESQSERPYLVYIASASPHKNFEIIASLLHALPRSLDALICKISVRAEEVPKLVESARKLGVLERIEFLGAVEDIDTLIAGAQAFVMPSKLESFGLPYYEAMAIGCPLIVSDMDFAREACGDAALYANPDSGEDFAAQVATILSSTAEQERFARLARERYEDVRISWDEVATAYRALLLEMV